jgi:hypothetical protein
MDTIAIVDISNQRCPIWTSPTAYAQARAQDTTDRLRPMEATWASGRTVMAYPANYRPAIHALHESEIPPSPTLELRRLIDTQPRISRNPFSATDTRRHEVPSEYRLAQEAGFRTLSLDRPSGDDDAGSLADTVTTMEMNPVTAVDPTTAFRIESERRSAYSGPLLRTTVTPDKTGQRAWIRTTGVPFQRRVRIERLRGEHVYVFDAHSFDKRHYQALERHYKAWLATWLRPGTTLTPSTFTAMAGRFRAARIRGYAGLNDPLDRDPFRFRFSEPELEAPYEEPDVEVTDEMAQHRFGRPLDLCYPEEIAELTDLLIEGMVDRGETVPMLRHLRGHPTWAQAVLARPHIGEYTASAADILE